MTDARISVDGELYLSLELVAELYHFDGVVLREVYDRGLFGPGVAHGNAVCIAAVRLDLVATVVRMHQVYGLDIDAITARVSAR